MKSKFKQWLQRKKHEHQMAQCYSSMEYSGIAVFGLCRGVGFPNCKDCKYYSEVKKND